MAALEEAAGLTTERKVQIALQKFSTAKMRSHTIEAAEQFLQAYTKGRLYMARAKFLAASMEPVQGDESALILHQRESMNSRTQTARLFRVFLVRSFVKKGQKIQRSVSRGVAL